MGFESIHTFKGQQVGQMVTNVTGIIRGAHDADEVLTGKKQGGQEGLYLNIVITFPAIDPKKSCQKVCNIIVIGEFSEETGIVTFS